MTTTPRKAFDILVYDKSYDVWNIEGKEHPGYNGEIKTWWIYFSDRLPEGLTPPIDSPHWKPFVKGCQRLSFEFQIKQKNTTKEKWGDTDFRNHTWVKIICNGKLFYSFSTLGGDSGIAFSFAKIQYLLVALFEHPFNFLNPDGENGRKIYWKGLPALVKIRSGEEKWEIGIVPDYNCGLNKIEWWKLLEEKSGYYNPRPSENDQEEMLDDKEYLQEYMRDDYINWGDAYSDKHIGWFRT